MSRKNEKSLTIQKGCSEAVNQRTDNTMAKRKRDNIRSRKSKNWQYNGQKKKG